MQVSNCEETYNNKRRIFLDPDYCFFMVELAVVITRISPVQ